MKSNPHISFSQVGPLIEAVRFLKSIGAPVDGLFARAGFPASSLEARAGIAPVAPFLRFVDLVATTQGIPDLGAQIGLHTAASALGPLAHVLLQAPSLGLMVHKSITLVRRISSATRLWLESDDHCMRFNWSRLDQTIGCNHADAYVLAIALWNVRTYLGNAWTPPWAALCGPPDAIAAFASALDVEIRPARSHNALAIPFVVLGSGPHHQPTGYAQPETNVPPNEFVEQVLYFIQVTLPDRLATAQNAAEAAGMSLRTFQRALKRDGQTFDGLVETLRIHEAQQLLAGGAASIAEVAFRLGYSDASNFTRAFRRNVGISPSGWRRLAGMAPTELTHMRSDVSDALRFAN